MDGGQIKKMWTQHKKARTVEKIQVKNYQSLYDVSLELGKFTVVFGDSDVGKSALYRAVRGLVTAETGDSFISKGKTRTGVSLTVPSEPPVEIIWLKSKGKSSAYKCLVGGEKAQEWNRATRLPGDLEKSLRFGQIVVDGDKFYPNFRGQFDPLFLLFESPGKRARVLGSLISNLLLKGIKTANLERNRAEADVRAMSELAESFEKKLDTDWSEIEKKIKGLKAVATNLERQAVGYTKLKIRQSERRVVKDFLESVKDADCSRLLYEIDVVLGGLRHVTVLKPLVQEREVVIKALSLGYSPIPQETFDKIHRMHEVFKEVKQLQGLRRIRARDIALGEMELKRCKVELESLEAFIEKMEKERTVTCPKCGEKFKWQK